MIALLGVVVVIGLAGSYLLPSALAEVAQPKNGFDTTTLNNTQADNALTHLRHVMDQYTDFNIYSEKWAVSNHFTPSGWMGDTGDITFDDADTSAPHTGGTAIRIDYSATGTQGWAGVYWQEPANNWGTVPDAGFDLSGVSRLTFWARGANGGEMVVKKPNSKWAASAGRTRIHCNRRSLPG